MTPAPDRENEAGGSSTLTEFCPENHSWILVPWADLPASPGATAGFSAQSRSDPAGCGSSSVEPPCSTSTHSVREAATAHPSLPLAADPPALQLISEQPSNLQEPMGGPKAEAEETSSLAVSELLDPGDNIPLSSEDLPASAPPTLTHELRNLCALGFPLERLSNESEGTKWAPWLPHEHDKEDDARSDSSDENLIDTLRELTRTWGKPIVFMAVLVASHTAALLLGMRIGKLLTTTPSSMATESMCSIKDPFLARRFSSSALGQQARVCAAN